MVLVGLILIVPVTSSSFSMPGCGCGCGCVRACVRAFACADRQMPGQTYTKLAMQANDTTKTRTPTRTHALHTTPTPHTNTRTEFIVHVDDSLAPVRGALPWGGTQPDLLVSLCETDVEPQHERMAVVVAQGLHVHTHQHPSPQCLYPAENTRRCSSAPILKIS